MQSWGGGAGHYKSRRNQTPSHQNHHHFAICDSLVGADTAWKLSEGEKWVLPTRGLPHHPGAGDRRTPVVSAAMGEEAHPQPKVQLLVSLNT